MRIIITGGAGFIGSHLCDALLTEGHAVGCIDNLSTGSMQNIAHLINHPRFSLLRGDVTLPYTWDQLRGPIDFIYNLACPASPIQYQKDPVQTLRTSLLGMMNALEAARTTNARVLQTSTSEIYGDPLVDPQPETYHGNVNTLGPRSCYDEGKRAAESLCFAYAQKYGVDVRIARIFNTYGPRMDINDGRVISTFIVQALRGENLTIFGDGSATRSFQYVDDLVRDLQLLMLSTCKQPVNLGNPDTCMTIKALATAIVDLIQSPSCIMHLPAPIDDPRQRRPDITRSNEVLGRRSRTPLSCGLVRTVRYFRALLKQQQSAATVSKDSSPCTAS